MRAKFILICGRFENELNHEHGSEAEEACAFMSDAVEALAFLDVWAADENNTSDEEMSAAVIDELCLGLDDHEDILDDL